VVIKSIGISDDRTLFHPAGGEPRAYATGL
jgi:hypothetical protein